MELLSCGVYSIAIIYLCKSRACDSFRVVNQASGHTPDVTVAQRDGDVRSGDIISVSSPTVGGVSTWNNTIGVRNETGREYVVTSPDIQSDTTVNAPTLDNGCPDGNVTYLCMNTSSVPDSPQENNRVITVINRVQLVITCAGFLANGATYLTLTCNGGRFSMLILLILKHQSLVDMGICGMGAIYLLLPARNWLTGNHVADSIVCYIWHSQGMFWGNVLVSTWNLVLIGVERYIMICKPFLYNTVTKRQFLYAFIGIYVGSFVFLIPTYIQVHFINGECLWQTIMGDFGFHFYYGYSFAILCVFYFSPVGAFVFLYG